MAECQIMDANGKSKPAVMGKDVKIIVCGNRKCGKTKFITAFTKRLGNTDVDVIQEGYANVYSAKYEMDSVVRDLKILKILGGPEKLISQLTEMHYDTNGIIFMYAIDDSSSFEGLEQKWILKLEENGCKDKQPCVLVGNKIDLRVENNPSHVSRVMGEFFKSMKEFLGLFETSSIDENDGNIHKAFHVLVEKAIQNWKEDTGQE